MKTDRLAQDFDNIKEIGYGGFGKVYSAICKKSKETFAIKIVKMHVKA